MKQNNITFSLSTLNLTAVANLLDDNRTYQDATKEVFLQKLSEVFEKFRELGDKKLKPYPGECASCECENEGKKGYCFVGKSGSFINLIIEQDESGVTDIYYCSDFKSKANVAPFCDIPLRISQDEKHDFVPSTNYLLKSDRCGKAVAEILARGPILSANDCIYWAAKYRELYNSFELPPFFFKKYNDFYELYKQVSAVATYIESEGTVKQANREFENLDADHIALLRYLTRNEQLYNRVWWLNFSVKKKYDEVESTGFLTVCEVNNLLLPVKTLEPLRTFVDQFQRPYYDMMAQYRIPTDDDQSPSRSLEELLRHHGVEL